MFSRNLAVLLVLCFAAAIIGRVEGFVAPQRVGGSSSSVHQTTTTKFRFPTSMQMSSSGNNKNDNNEEDKLRALGYSEDEIRRSKKESDPPEINVRVDLVGNVDSVTLTAIGFGAIAFNFFVLANMGDGGIGGVVATIINTVNQ
jgi:hypothetical protein